MQDLKSVLRVIWMMEEGGGGGGCCQGACGITCLVLTQGYPVYVELRLIKLVLD